jgi:hypothetical protein
MIYFPFVVDNLTNHNKNVKKGKYIINQPRQEL